MAILDGYFNSVSGDRKYDAEDMNYLIDGILDDGVLSTIGGTFVVTAQSGMQVQVATGKAWFNKSWIWNTSTHYVTVPDSAPILNRIDTIVLDMDKSTGVRQNDIIIIEGDPDVTPSAPTLISTSTHVQIPLCDIYVAASVSVITNGDITNRIGTAACPFATGILQQVDITTLLAQWEAQFNAWMQEIEDILESIDTGDIFNILNTMIDRPIKGRNLIINGGMLTQRNGASTVTGYFNSFSQGQYPGVADRWKFNLSEAGTWTISQDGSLTTDLETRNALKVLCTTARASLVAASIFYVRQTLPAEKFAEWNKGWGLDSKPLTLSWKMKSNKTGTYVVELQETSNLWSISYAISYDVADVWEEFVFSIPPETQHQLAMNYGTAGQVHLTFFLSAGTNYTSGTLQTLWGATNTPDRAVGQLNLADTVNNYFCFSDVQLEIGDVQTPFERQSEEECRLLCEEFFELRDDVEGLGVATGVNTLVAYGPKFRTKKYISPTYGYFSGSIYTPTAQAVTAVVESGLGVSRDDIIMTLTTGATLTVGNIYRYHISLFTADGEI